MTDYKVKFEVFEGPLDLLLYLIKKEEVDIYQVNLTHLATEFLNYLDLMRMFDLEIAGEFLVMAATLLYIKSRELLPLDQQVHDETEDETEDPRWELIRQLVEYKKFKDAAGQLQELERQQELVYPRLPAPQDLHAEPELPKGNVSIFDLINAVNQFLKRLEKPEDVRDIFEDKWTVTEKIEHIIHSLTRQPKIKFSALFATATSRHEIVVTFLALLELIRLKQITATQDAPFVEIDIERTEEPWPVQPEPAATQPAS